MTDTTSSRRKGIDRRKDNRRVGFDRRMPERKFLANEYIFQEGESARLCYQIVSGKVGIYKSIHGDTKEIVEFVAGDIFGEMALIDNSLRRASAVAKETTILKQIHQRAFLDYLSQSPDIAMSIMKRLMAYARSSMDSSETDIISRAADSFDHEGDFLDAKHISNTKDTQDVIDAFQSPSESLLRSKISAKTSWAILACFCLVTFILMWTSMTKVDVTISASGQLSSTVSEVTVYSDYETRLKQLNISLGDKVKQGEIIATLIPSPDTVPADKGDVVSELDGVSELEIVAPLDGLISDIGELYPGTSITLGQKVASILPTQLPITVDLNIRARDLQHVAIGDQVSVRIPAFPHLNHGELKADIALISNETNMRKHDTHLIKAAESYYSARAIITENNLRNLPKGFSLLPGTQIQSEIIVDRRRLIDYFIYPVMETLDRSFSEP